MKIKYRMDAVVLKHINSDASNYSNKGCQTILHARMVSQVFASQQLERKITINKSFIWETLNLKACANSCNFFSLFFGHFPPLFSELFGTLCSFMHFWHFLTLLGTFWNFLAKQKCHV